MDVTPFAELNDGQRKDLLQAAPSLGLDPLTVRDVLRIGRGEWAVWFVGEVLPQIGNAADGHELHHADLEDLADIARLRWWIEQTGERPPEGTAVPDITGWGQVEVIIGADIDTGRYVLQYSAWDHPDAGCGVVPDGEDVERLIEEELMDTLVHIEHEDDAWSQANERIER